RVWLDTLRGPFPGESAENSKKKRAAGAGKRHGDSAAGEHIPSGCPPCLRVFCHYSDLRTRPSAESHWPSLKLARKLRPASGPRVSDTWPAPERRSTS